MARPAVRHTHRVAAKKPDHRRRAAQALRLAARAGATHLLITNPVDVGYLTGFLGGDSYLLLGPGRPVILSDFRYQEELGSLGPACRVVLRKGSMVEALTAETRRQRVRRLAVQTEHVTLALRAAMNRHAKGLRIVPASGLLAGLRALKDASEVALLRQAIRIGEEAFQATLPLLDQALARSKGGISELEIAAILESEMKRRGSARPSFDTIVAARANGSHPHYRPGRVRLSRNQPLLVDWGATWQGYHGDMTRTLCWGRWPRKLAEIYEVVSDAHDLAAAALAPGMTTRAVDAAAREHITRAGYGDNFGHGLGHGIGLDIHENPRLSHMLEPTTLEPGHVVTIEPGIYLPGVGGVRIENDYLVTRRGCECLCTLPRSRDWATR